MLLLIDADGLIKLHRAGVLTVVVSVFSCVIPQTVHHEVVTVGKERLYQDAEAIEWILSDSVSILPVQVQEEPGLGLGAGELGLMSLLNSVRDAVVVSDDRRFLAELRARGVQFLTPAHVVVALARRGVLTGEEAREALDRLRPAIRSAAYWEARQDLEAEGEPNEEK